MDYRDYKIATLSEDDELLMALCNIGPPDVSISAVTAACIKNKMAKAMPDGHSNIIPLIGR